MRAGRLLQACLGVAVLGCLFPTDAFAWTAGTHVFLGEAILGNLGLLPAAVADLLRTCPLDFLYGSIAADTSFAKKYAPIGRHCHHWPVGQEVLDRAGTEAQRAFGWGYLAHLAADVVAHNHYVPHQLVLTSTTVGAGHAYWEARVEPHLGRQYSAAARDLLRQDHADNDAHLDRILSPTLFSVGTSRRLFRGMVRVTRSAGWQRSMETARTFSRWRLDDAFLEAHLALSFDYAMAVLAGDDQRVRRRDPSGEAALAHAKPLRRSVLAEGLVGRPLRLREAAAAEYGLPSAPRPWLDAARWLSPTASPAGAAGSPSHPPSPATSS